MSHEPVSSDERGPRKDDWLDGFFRQPLDRRTMLGELLGGSAAVATVLTGSMTLSPTASARDSAADEKEAALRGGKAGSGGGATVAEGGGDASSQRLLSGRAWDDYCEMLKLTGRYIEKMGGEGIELSDLDRIEWYRYVTRITRNALERFIENAEPRAGRGS